MVKIGINGFGRIGRCVLRALYESDDNSAQLIGIKRINSPSAVEDMSHLLQYDSVHGIFSKNVYVQSNKLAIDGKEIIVTTERDIEKLDWQDVDIVIDCTGKFNDGILAKKHIDRGCKKVILSAPGKNVDMTVVYGVNHKNIENEHNIISTSSCTTNCLAPVINVLKKNNINIVNGMMTTIHSYTNDQNLIDNSHKKDMRRARAASMSMIPTSTGATKSIGEIFPDMIGKLDGYAVRVPTANVSALDFTFNIEDRVSVEALNAIFKTESEDSSSVVGYSDKPLVSCDFNHSVFSAVIDADLTKVSSGGKMCRLFAWYDNEWAFSLRILDIIRYLSSEKNSLI